MTTATTAGDIQGAVNALVNLPAVVADAFLNGFDYDGADGATQAWAGLLTWKDPSCTGRCTPGGPIYQFLVGIPTAIAAAINNVPPTTTTSTGTTATATATATDTTAADTTTTVAQAAVAETAADTTTTVDTEGTENAEASTVVDTSTETGAAGETVKADETASTAAGFQRKRERIGHCGQDVADEGYRRFVLG